MSHDIRLLFPTLSVAAAAGLALALPGADGARLVGLALLMVAVFLMLTPCRPHLLIYLALNIALAGLVILSSAGNLQRVPEALSDVSESRRPIIVTLVMEQAPQQWDVSSGVGKAKQVFFQARAAIRSTNVTGGDNVGLPVAVSAQASVPITDLRRGDELTVSGTFVRQPRLMVKVRAILNRTAAAPTPVDSLREKFQQGVQRVWVQWPQARALLPGMVIGDRSGQSQELDAAMKVAGLTHLTAVSGSNCFMVLAGVTFAARLVWAPRWPVS